MKICDLFRFETLKIHQAEKEGLSCSHLVKRIETRLYQKCGEGKKEENQSIYVSNHLHIQSGSLMPIPHSVGWAKGDGYFLQHVGFDFFSET